MSRRTIDEFRERRADGQAKLEALEHLGIKRLSAIDSRTYNDSTGEGGLDERTKELLGLVASTVLRCDDCIAYHVERCVSLGFSRTEIVDAMSVAYVVGGSITVPHLRRAVTSMDELLAEREAGLKRGARDQSWRVCTSSRW